MEQEIFGKGSKEIEPQEEHEKRIVLVMETLASLLPMENNAMRKGEEDGNTYKDTSICFCKNVLRIAIL